MVRLKDIAQIAGVSVMTVSKALRDAPDVSAETSAKLKSLALPLGALMLGVSFGAAAVKFKGLETAVRGLAGVLLVAVGFYFLWSY